MPDDKKYTADSVAEMMEYGLDMERITRDHYRNVVSKEKTFMECPHVESDAEEIETDERQMELF